VSRDQDPDGMRAERTVEDEARLRGYTIQDESQC
jgi:hypothetical protein